MDNLSDDNSLYFFNTDGVVSNVGAPYGVFKRLRVAILSGKREIIIPYTHLNIPHGITVFGTLALTSVDGNRVPDTIQLIVDTNSDNIIIQLHTINNGVIVPFVPQNQIAVDVLLFY